MEQILNTQPNIYFVIACCGVAVTGFVIAFERIYKLVKKDDSASKDNDDKQKTCEKSMGICEAHVNIEKALSKILERIDSVKEIQNDIKVRLDKEFDEIYLRIRKLEARTCVLEALVFEKFKIPEDTNT